jgi:hypothetical protein
MKYFFKAILAHYTKSTGKIKVREPYEIRVQTEGTGDDVETDRSEWTIANKLCLASKNRVQSRLNSKVATHLPNEANFRSPVDGAMIALYSESGRGFACPLLQ